jgi:hypothetical protein
VSPMTDPGINIYFSGAYANKALVNVLADTLCGILGNMLRRPVRPTSRWHNTRAGTLAEMAQNDLDDLVTSDLVVVSHPPGKSGTNTEIGFAIGRGIPVYYLVDPDLRHELPFGAHAKGVHVMWSFNDLLGYLAGEYGSSKEEPQEVEARSLG